MNVKVAPLIAQLMQRAQTSLDHSNVLAIMVSLGMVKHAMVCTL